MPSLRLLMVALLVGLTGSFHFGIQITITNPSQQTFLQFLNSSLRTNYEKEMDTNQLENLWSLIVAMLFFGAIFGSLLIRPLADRLGRLRVLILNRFELFFLARFGIGFSLALCLGLAGIFLAECSPKGCRGSVSMSTGALLQLGTVFGSLMAIPTVLGSSNRWWAMFTIEGIQLFVTTILLALFAKESPSIGSVVSLSMAFSGIAVINAFAVELFRATGISEYWSSIDNVGLALLIILVMNVVISGLMHAYAQTRLNWLGLCLSLAISLFVIAFAFGPGPICYFLSAELVEQNARSAAQGWANLCQMIGRTLLLVIFLPLRGSIGAGFAYFSLFVPPVLVALIFLFFYLPETKNRNFDEVRRGKRQLPRSPLKLNKATVFFSKGSAGPKVGWTNIVVNGGKEGDGN
uniref:MFS domain-containing protein n=1 Tax=Globodera pallida TaxID=36090 RepID=A0A183CBC4_GLOPA